MPRSPSEVTGTLSRSTLLEACLPIRNWALLSKERPASVCGRGVTGFSGWTHGG